MHRCGGWTKARANNHIVQQRNRGGAASFFLESSDQEIDDTDVDEFLSVCQIKCESINQTRGCCFAKLCLLWLSFGMVEGTSYRSKKCHSGF